MAVTTAVARVAANTAVALQDITVSGFGTPKAAIFIMTRAATDEVTADHANFGYGATDGTNQFYCTYTAEDGQATSDCNERINGGNVIGLLNPGQTAKSAEANFDSWITDGVRINWSNLPSIARLLTVIFFGGDSLEAFVGNDRVSNVQNAVITVANVGFESHLIFSAMINGENLGSATGSNAEISLGAIHNNTNGNITQRSYALNDEDGQPTTVVATRISDVYGLFHVTSAAANLDWGCEFSNFTANGFDLTERLAGGNSTEIFYLCLRGASPDDFKVGTHTTPIVLGDDSETGVGFRPQFVMLGQTLVETVNTGASTSPNAGTQGISAFTPTAEFSNMTFSDDGAATSNTGSISFSNAVGITDKGTQDIQADLVAMIANGYTLNYSQIEATAKQFWFAAIKDTAVTQNTFDDHPWVVPTMWTVPYWRHR